MNESVLMMLASFPVIGIAAQWLAWRIRVPSILVLLLAGFLFGPILGLVDPDLVLGDLIPPIVSLSVAIILFEGGLSLKFQDIKQTGKVVRNLVTIGAISTWLITTLAAIVFLGFETRLAILLGAILVVTGPTVVIPLLKHIRLQKSISSILRWEGILIDPVGAMFAVLVFEVVFSSKSEVALEVFIAVIVMTLISGVVLGVLGGFVLMFFIQKRWIPEYLQEAVTLMLVMGVDVVSHQIQHESGLLAVTVMGIFLANQRIVKMKKIVAFKENLTILLLASLFVILAARIDVAQLMEHLNIQTALFVGSIIFIARPLSVFISTLGQNIPIKESVFLSGMAPRGIIAAAVSVLFALKLETAGVENATKLVPVTFMVIIVTVAVYGLFGRPFAKLLDLKTNQKGVLIAGAYDWTRQLGKMLKSYGIPVLIVDTEKENVLAAKDDGLDTIHASVLSQRIIEEVEVGAVGKLIAVTKSDETNLLAMLEYGDVFGHSYVFRLYPQDKRKDLVSGQQENFLFGKGITQHYISTRMKAGGSIASFGINQDYTYEKFTEENPKAIPLCVINDKNKLLFVTGPKTIQNDKPQIVIALV